MSLKILTVDDSKTIRMIVKKAFRPYDCMLKKLVIQPRRLHYFRGSGRLYQLPFKIDDVPIISAEFNANQINILV